MSGRRHRVDDGSSDAIALPDGVEHPPDAMVTFHASAFSAPIVTETFPTNGTPALSILVRSLSLAAIVVIRQRLSAAQQTLTT